MLLQKLKNGRGVHRGDYAGQDLLSKQISFWVGHPTLNGSRAGLIVGGCLLAKGFARLGALLSGLDTLDATPSHATLS